MNALIAALGGGAGIAAVLYGLAKLIQALRRVGDDAATAAAELSPNHGGSVKDGLTATRKELGQINQKLDLLISSSSDAHKLMIDHLHANDRDIADIKKRISHL
ncbi:MULTISPECIES: hypothetical protein [unclassified Actinotignum]|uniref:hypothetical protein n=1 Tax=unclassified Actinotignum TaxID=2632702 RepID=UPI002A81001B|nr:hypothetical protein [Actinotignum sp. SLA_B059]MDY5127471.1 hypothetical protein [Actinotignum sp. SLA_B059]